ncbi:hypothetical protein UCRPC4_g01170 [Phaeomoniella chlamydospora]|uniref:Uncharacterized protein n=1 Tax=Phaeomoniella chlamydospora TaxID=158046 RepID=A0A0G2GVI9_PHACM|nr:hypothetical protein UCRPC4_g01170 [Phaeomoniella chlamydospora]
MPLLPVIGLPRFERNDETLQALLALVAANVAADERAELLLRAQEEEAEQWSAIEKEEDHSSDTPDAHRSDFVPNVTNLLEEMLDPEASEALDSLAESSLALGALSTSTTDMSQAIVDMAYQQQHFQHHVKSIESLQRSLESETRAMQDQLSELEQSKEKSAESQETMQQQIADWTRASKLLAVKFDEYRDRVSRMQKGSDLCTIEDLRVKERDVLRQKGQLRMLERELHTYQGLPSDLDAAREEYRRLNDGVMKLRRRRDEFFEYMASR